MCQSRGTLPAMRITVGICTYNRAERLRSTLNSIAALHVPRAIDWEVLVVDNNSSDATRAVVASFGETLPVRYLFEPSPGKSNALNRAVREANGDYIVWTDDDVLVYEDWIDAYVSAFQRVPEAVVFGGPVDPWFETGPPEWLARIWDEARNAYAVLPADVGKVERDRGPGPFGANLAVRTDIQRRFPYDPSLGPQPGSPIRGEETAVVQAILRSGYLGCWVPDARVRHLIPRERQTVQFLRETFYGFGLFSGLQGVFDTMPRFAGKPRYLWRQIAESELRYCLGRLLHDPSMWGPALIQSAMARGTFSGLARRTGSRRRGQ